MNKTLNERDIASWIFAAILLVLGKKSMIWVAPVPGNIYLFFSCAALKGIEELKGRIRCRFVEMGALPEHNIISTNLLSGRTVVPIYSTGNPGNGFEIVKPHLEDVYFWTMAGHITQDVGQQKKETQP